MSKWVAALLGLSFAGCASGSSNSNSSNCSSPAWIDGTHTAQIFYHLTDSAGTDDSADFTGNVVIDQVGSALWYWGVVSELCGSRHEFGSSREEEGFFGYLFFTFSGEGSGFTGKTDLVVHGEIRDDPANDPWYSWDSEWSIALEGFPPNQPEAPEFIRDVSPVVSDHRQMLSIPDEEYSGALIRAATVWPGMVDH